MSTVLIVAIVFGSILTFAAMICGTVIAIIKMRQTGFSKNSKASRTDEARLIQEIYHGLARMEKRVETLETILMDAQDRERKSS